MSNYIGYNDTSYDIISNSNYKKKRIFKKKKLLINNFNILLFITLILIIFYIPFNFCFFNFHIYSDNTDNNTDNTDNRNFCQNSILYILNFKNIYISSIFYISIISITLYFIYTSPFFTILYKYYIKSYLSYFIGCSYEYMYDIKNTIIHFDVLIKELQYAKIYDLFCKFMILLIIFLFFIAFLLFAALSLYNYLNNDNLSLENIEERLDNLSHIINNTDKPFINVSNVL